MRNNTRVTLLPYSQYHIGPIISEGGGDPWRLTCVYGEAQVADCHKTWDMLKFTKASSSLPWLCIGNFNKVLYRSEHVGVQERSLAQIAGFRENDRCLRIVRSGVCGKKLDFGRKVEPVEIIAEFGWIYRALACAAWTARFPWAIVYHHTSAASNHGPMKLRWDNRARSGWKNKKQFK